MNNSNKVLSNFIWRFAERCGAQVVQTIVSIVLARLLAPEVFGTIALVIVFSNILQVFVDSGLGNALIQKKDADDVDFSSVFYFNIVWCVVLYIIIYLLAPFIAGFYQDESLVAVIRVLCITVLISGVKNVQQAYVSKTLQFRKFFFSTMFGTIASAVAGIALAFKGYGIWALVAQKLVNLSIDTVVLWITVKWRPKRAFSFERLKGLISYGWKLLVSSLIDTLYNNLRQLIIGKLYTEADLAYYNQGRQIPDLIVNNINTSIDSVLLPVMSSEQEDKARVKEMTRRAVKTSTFVLAPMMLGLAAAAPAIIEILLTEKWIDSVFYLRIFCITYMFYPIHTANLNAIKAMGRSDLFLKLEITKKIVGLILLVSTMWFGVEAMTYSLLLSSLCSQIINTKPNKELLGYGYIEQLKDILPNILLAAVMAIVVSAVGFFELPIILELCIQIILGVVIYVAGAYVTKNETLQYVFGILTPMLKKILKR